MRKVIAWVMTIVVGGLWLLYTVYLIFRAYPLFQEAQSLGYIEDGGLKAFAIILFFLSAPLVLIYLGVKGLHRITKESTHG